MSFLFLCFLLYLSSLLILPSSSSSSSSTTITLSLSKLPHSIPSQKSSEFASHIAKSTLLRAHYLKHPSKKPTSVSSLLHGTSSVPLYARSYGGYSVPLAIGTPPQLIPVVFDTGSSLVWVPCTSKYSCTNCTFSNVDPKNITTFKPKLSSSTKLISCRNPKCGWLYGPDVAGRCSGTGTGTGTTGNTTGLCPSYLLQYGLGATTGLAISERLNLPGRGKVVPDFLLGCSILSLQQPSGIAGFGRAPDSLPSQLKLRKFFYCLLSHRLDDTPKSSRLILVGAGKNISSANKVMKGVKYTPFRKNPDVSPYDEYYYINLLRITVGEKQVRVKIPRNVLVPDESGNGGVIVDSGSTLTFMESILFKPLVKELVAQMGHLKRAREAEALSGFGLCFDISSGRNVSISIPDLVFHFKGGTKMELAVENYFSVIGDVGALCLTIVTDATSPAAAPGGRVRGPVMILGNFQQQDFYVEYDLERQRMGFKKQKCG